MKHTIRIAQCGWHSDHAAETMDEVAIGIGVYWVEIDWHRIDDVCRVEFTADKDEFTVARMTMDVMGPVEIVYVNEQGEPLPGDPAVEPYPGNIGMVDGRTFAERP